MLVYSTLIPAAADGRWLFWVLVKEQSNCCLHSFMTFDDCGSWGGSFVAELVSLCENPVLGRMPFSSTKTSNWPRREDQEFTDQCCCAPTGPGTVRPVPSEAILQISQGYQAVLHISQAPLMKTTSEVYRIKIGIRKTATFSRYSQ